MVENPDLINRRCAMIAGWRIPTLGEGHQSIFRDSFIPMTPTRIPMVGWMTKTKNDHKPLYNRMLWPWPSDAFWLDLVGWSARPNTAWKTKYKQKRLSSIFHQQSPDDTRLLPTPQIYQIPGENVGKSSCLLTVGWDIFFAAWPSVCWLQPFFSELSSWPTSMLYLQAETWPRMGSEFTVGITLWICWIRSEARAFLHQLVIYICSGWWLTYPFWKIWLRQLGWCNSQYMENHKIHVPNHQPAYIYIYSWLSRVKSTHGGLIQWNLLGSFQVTGKIVGKKKCNIT